MDLMEREKYLGILRLSERGGEGEEGLVRSKGCAPKEGHVNEWEDFPNGGYALFETQTIRLS